jgi:excisionase family DNA binding protein
MPASFPVQLPSGRIEEQPFLSPAELAEKLHVSRKTVYRRIESGEWPHTRVVSKVYFSPADVAAIMDAAHYVPPAHVVGGN